jgi:hypothetical protein
VVAARSQWACMENKVALRSLAHSDAAKLKGQSHVHQC